MAKGGVIRWRQVKSSPCHSFKQGTFFFVTAILCASDICVHATHVSTSCPIMCIVQTRIAQGGGGDPQWMWTSRKKRLNTLATWRKKSWTTRDEAHTGRTWRYGSRVVGSDVTWRDSKHVTHCPNVTLWHHSLVDKCLGSNVMWYLIRASLDPLSERIVQLDEGLDLKSFQDVFIC